MKYANQRGKNASSILATSKSQKYATVAQRKRNINSRNHQKALAAVALKNKKIQQARAAKEAAMHSGAHQDQAAWRAIVTQRKRNINSKNQQHARAAVAFTNQKIQEAQRMRAMTYEQKRNEAAAHHAVVAQRKRNINSRNQQHARAAVAYKNQKNQKIQDARAVRADMHQKQSDALYGKSQDRTIGALQRRHLLNYEKHQKGVEAVALTNQKIQEARRTKMIIHEQKRNEAAAQRAVVRQRKSLKNLFKGFRIPVVSRVARVPKRSNSVSSRNSPLIRQNSTSTANSRNSHKSHNNNNRFKGLRGAWASALHTATAK